MNAIPGPLFERLAASPACSEVKIIIVGEKVYPVVAVMDNRTLEPELFDEYYQEITR